MVFEVPEDVLNMFKDTYEKVKNKVLVLPPHNYNLAGQIKEEYSLEHLIEAPCINEYLSNTANAYVDFFGLPRRPMTVDPKGDDWDIQLKSMWINIQKKHEYNPIHRHDGVLSFALWLKIPYEVKAELEIEQASKANTHTNGKFFFHHINSLGEIANESPKDDEYREGNLVIFPSQLNHSVYPFYTSDDDRVSISGNFYYTPKGTK